MAAGGNLNRDDRTCPFIEKVTARCKETARAKVSRKG